MEKISIQGVPETMLQTLYARAAYSQKKNRKFEDKMAVQIVEKMDYDFSRAEKDSMMSSGVIARTILLDRMVKEFVRDNPGAAVINIACGMDTRFYRVDNGQILWYNIDLPETIEVRRRFLKEEGRVCVIARSAMDEAWAAEIEKQEGEALVIIEGLAMYLTEEDVRQILNIIDRHFERVQVIMETMNPWVVSHMKEKSIEATSAKFTWGLKSGKDLEGLAPNLKWVRDVSLVEGMKEFVPVYRLVGRIPAVRNISNKLVVLRKELRTGE